MGSSRPDARLSLAGPVSVLFISFSVREKVKGGGREAGRQTVTAPTNHIKTSPSVSPLLGLIKCVPRVLVLGPLNSN